MTTNKVENEDEAEYRTVCWRSKEEDEVEDDATSEPRASTLKEPLKKAEATSSREIWQRH